MRLKCIFCLTSFSNLLPYYAKGTGHLIGMEFDVSRKSHLSKSELRDPKTFPQIYRSFEILHKIGMHATGRTLLPFNILTTKYVIFCQFTLLRHWKTLDTSSIAILFVSSLGQQASWLAVLEFAGSFHKNSKEAIYSWKYMKCKNSGDAKYLRKFRRSCRTLGIGEQGLFIIKRLSVIKFTRDVIKGTAKALVAL
jgi:hypothetical protein